MDDPFYNLQIYDELGDASDKNNEDDDVSNDSTEDEDELESGCEDSEYELSDGDLVERNNVINNLADNDIFVGVELNLCEEFSNSDNSDDMQSLCSDEDYVKKSKGKYPEWNSERDMKNPQFHLGQLFATAEDFRNAIREYSILHNKEIEFKKNEKWRVRAKCSAPCEWMIFASKVQDEDTLQVKTLKDKHTICRPIYENRNVTSTWLAKKYLPTIKTNPEWPLEAFRATVKNDHKIEVSRTQVYKARKKAKLMINGNHKEQYRRLWDYCAEIKRAMPGSTLKVDYTSGENPRFKRFYCCLAPLKEGFAVGCRPFICLDGCFLKGPYPGQLLSAVGIDANNGIYPVAYAVVEKETKKSWTWFLELLCDDIGFVNGLPWTFMSDQQKGLVPALRKVVPQCAHRFCVRHHHNNFKKKFPGKGFKDQFWKCAKATTLEYLNKSLEEMKELREGAYKWIDKSDISPEHWSRAYFSPDSKCDLLINNHCEVWNALILEARDKPIISLMESIRNLLMKRFTRNFEKMQRYPGVICPKIREKLDKMIKESYGFISQWSGGSEFQVQGPYVQYTVDLNEKTCSCRKWDLSGIPCAHGVAAILNQRRDPESFVHQCYLKENYLNAYKQVIAPINGADLWPTSGKRPLMEPIVETQPGRKKKNRRKELGEKKRDGKLGKNKVVMSCRLCGNSGHNSRTCKGQNSRPSSSAATVKKGIGRVKLPVRKATPSQQQSQQSFSGMPPLSQSQN